MGCVSKKEIINQICSERKGYKRDNVTNVVNDVFKHITIALARKDSVKLHGFGTFAMTKRAARVGRNPKTGDRIEIPERISLTFRPSKDLKEIIK